MTTDFEEVRSAREKAEETYDAMVTKINRVQSQLANKAAQVQKLSPEDYRIWIADKKKELGDAQVELQEKKKARAEARRQFNGWQPPYEEEWLEWPDCGGYWWFHGYAVEGGAEVLDIHEFYEDEGSEYQFTSGDDEFTIKLRSMDWIGRWKFQEEPKTPELPEYGEQS